MNNRIFFYPGFRRYVLFTANALDHMYAYIQRRLWYKEAGGEIYVPVVDTHGLVVTAATGPNLADRRKRHFFNPDIDATTQNRNRLFTQGLHAVGLWHTHPEVHPIPSLQDYKAAEQYLDAFHGDRNFYLLVILGNCGSPTNMTVWSVGQDVRINWIEPV